MAEEEKKDPDEAEDISVRVYVRIRPLNKREIAEKQTIGWNFNKTAMLEDTPNGQRVYAYDTCFGPNSTNQETYDIVGKPVVVKAMAGFNGTVFTYGQTGSGKTWTMRGSDSDPGMMILCIRDIFEYVKDHPDKEYTLKVSYMEVYNEEINDLLNSGEDSKNLKITAEDAVRGAVIGNLVEEEVKTPDEFMEVLYKGEANRSYASTSMNDNSSRSHVIYRVTILIKDIAEADDGLDENGFMRKDDGSFSGAVSYMNLVDLAGSERQKSTNATGKTLKEGANINKSLLALGAVINKLGQQGKKGKGKKDNFVPYRDSKLTRILKQSLGGNTITSIMLAVTPAPMHREETVSTLKFGQLCKLIKNSVASNVVVDDKALMKQYRATIADLKLKLDEAQAAGGGGGGAMAAAERSSYTDRIKVLEELVVSSGGDVSSAGEFVAPTIPTSSGGGGGGNFSDEEVLDLRSKNAELSRRVNALTSEADGVNELKANLEEYERSSRAELEEETAKLEADKHSFSVERCTILADITALDEKEGNVGQLIANLDERESKLRHLLGTLKEQQEQWQRAVSDLKRREDLVDEWQKNHGAREAKLDEVAESYNETFEQLTRRERATVEGEQVLKSRQKELQEREQRLQVALSRAAKTEQEAAEYEQRVKDEEKVLRNREHECDLRNREVASRRRELESWDQLLREKDAKLVKGRQTLSARESAQHENEEELKMKKLEYDKDLSSLRSLEGALREKTDTLNFEKAELDKKIQELAQKQRDYEIGIDRMDKREASLKEREAYVARLISQLQDLESREADLSDRISEHKRKEDEFFNVRVQQITTRHARELSEMEKVVADQLAIITKYQDELDRVRGELTAAQGEHGEMQRVVEAKEVMINQLKSEMEELEHGGDMFVSRNSDAAHKGGTGDARKGGTANKDNPDGRDTGEEVERKGKQEEVPREMSSDASQSAQQPLIRDHAARLVRDGSRAHSDKRDFVYQLAETQNLLHDVLRKHNASTRKRAKLLKKSALGPPSGHRSSSDGFFAGSTSKSTSDPAPPLDSPEVMGTYPPTTPYSGDNYNLHVGAPGAISPGMIDPAMLAQLASMGLQNGISPPREGGSRGGEMSSSGAEAPAAPTQNGNTEVKSSEAVSGKNSRGNSRSRTPDASPPPGGDAAAIAVALESPLQAVMDKQGPVDDSEELRASDLQTVDSGSKEAYEIVENDATQFVRSKTASSRIVIKKDRHATPKGLSGSGKQEDNDGSTLAPLDPTGEGEEGDLSSSPSKDAPARSAFEKFHLQGTVGTAIARFMQPLNKERRGARAASKEKTSTDVGAVGGIAASEASARARSQVPPTKPTFSTGTGERPLSKPMPKQAKEMHFSNGIIREEHRSHVIRKKRTKSPTARNGSPERHTFDIDDKEMAAFVERGVDREEGVPVTKIELGFGLKHRTLLAAAETSSKKHGDGRLKK